jgi:glycosyltransferase 2 family protein
VINPTQRQNVDTPGAKAPLPAAELADQSTPHRRLRWILRATVIAIVVIGTGWMLRGIDLAAMANAMANAKFWPIAIAALLNFVIMYCKAVAWRLLLGPHYPVPIRRLFGYTITSYAASAILPIRAGEIVRLWMLRDREGVPVSRAAAVAVAEKLLHVAAIMIVVAPIPWLIDELPTSLRWWIAGIAMAMIAALIILRVVARRLTIESWLGRFASGMSVIHQPRVFFPGLALLLIAVLTDLAQINLTLWAVGIDLPVDAAILVLFTVNITIALPSTPGQVGALQLGAMIGLGLLHAPEANSLAFAILYHVLQLIPLVAAGLLLHSRDLLSWRRRRSP